RTPRSEARDLSGRAMKYRGRDSASQRDGQFDAESVVMQHAARQSASAPKSSSRSRCRPIARLTLRTASISLVSWRNSSSACCRSNSAPARSAKISSTDSANGSRGNWLVVHDNQVPDDAPLRVKQRRTQITLCPESDELLVRREKLLQTLAVMASL